MPEAPLKFCNAAGCNRLTRQRFCDSHRKQPRPRSAQANRPTPPELGYGYKWRQASKAFRASHPLCVSCQAVGITRAAECVDHIKPHSGPDDPLFWDVTNWQSLCWSCHSRKTRRDSPTG